MITRSGETRGRGSPGSTRSSARSASGAAARSTRAQAPTTSGLGIGEDTATMTPDDITSTLPRLLSTVTRPGEFFATGAVDLPVIRAHVDGLGGGLGLSSR